MPKITYVPRRFSPASRAMIDKANAIINEYEEAGFDLTLRQLYYQFVSRDMLPNNIKSYHKLASVVNDGRLAGLIDWNRIVDRTRGIESLVTWDSPQEMIDYRARSFITDKWATQPCRPEVWIEKEALAGVFERVCNELRVPYLSCRGYTSQSEMWRAGRRLREYSINGQQPYILHFGDHDPSGVDMSRDIVERLEMFAEGSVDFQRLALNMDQIEEYSPPPNPAKLSDSRATAYIASFGDESWELDALDPATLAGLVKNKISSIIDQDAWAVATEVENEHKRLLQVVAKQWSKITTGL